MCTHTHTLTHFLTHYTFHVYTLHLTLLYTYMSTYPFHVYCIPLLVYHRSPYHLFLLTKFKPLTFPFVVLDEVQTLNHIAQMVNYDIVSFILMVGFILISSQLT